jgi:hypothetical protein
MGETSVLTRLGRVAHWIGLACAALFLMASVVAAIFGADASARLLWVIFLPVAALCYIAGRAVRYVLADE